MFIKRKFNTDKIYINYTVVQTVRVKLIRKTAVRTILYYVEYGDKMLPIHQKSILWSIFQQVRISDDCIWSIVHRIPISRFQDHTIHIVSVHVSKYSAQYSGTNGYFVP